MHPRRNRPSALDRHACLGLALLILAMIAAPGIGQAASAKSKPDSKPVATSIERSLAGFTQAFSEARLLGSKAQITFDIPLPARWQPLELRLDLVYSHSVNLLRAHSQLRIELNGLIIAQLQLDPTRPEGRAQIRLPLDLLQSGYNRLTFAVAQHTQIAECEDPNAPELWTQIDTQRSRLRLDYVRRPPNARLSALDEFFDPRLWTQESWRILMPASPNPDSNESTALDDDQLAWGALIAQAAAIHLGFVPPIIESAPLTPDTAQDGTPSGLGALNETDLHKRDAILVGTRDQLSPFLGDAWAAEVSDGYLGLLTHPLDATRLLLVVSGRDAREVERAAMALASIESPFPDRQQVLVRDLDPPLIPTDRGPDFVPGGSAVRFEDLGAPTTTLVSPLATSRWFIEPGFAGADSQVSVVQPRLRVNFWIRPGFNVMGSKDARLRLSFSYGASLRRDSVLNILLNGFFVRGIPLNEPTGASLDGYELRIPASLLRSGRNQLELVPMLVELETDRCQLHQGENLLLTVFGDSTLELPPMSQFTQLPDLELLSRTGFPLTRDPQGADLAIQVAGGSREAAGAAWTLLARLSQISRVPLHRARIGANPDFDDRESIVIGTLDDLDSTLRSAAPLRLEDNASQIDYRTLRTIEIPDASLAWWERGLASIQGWFEARLAGPNDFRTRVTYVDRPLGEHGVLMAFESPGQSGRSVLLLSAAEPDRLKERAAQLVQPEYWFNLRGSLVLWGERPETLRWQPARQTFTVGDGPTQAQLSHLFGLYPQALWILLLGLAALLALLLLILMRRFRRHHHPLIYHED